MAKQPSIHAQHRMRVRTRYLKSGADAFSEHELLELLLFYGIPYKDTNPTAHRLIDSMGSLLGVLRASTEELTVISGVGPYTARFLHTVERTVSVALQSVHPKEKTVFSSLEDVRRFLLEHHRETTAPTYTILFCNREREWIDTEDFPNSEPTVENTSVPFLSRLALKHHASALILTQYYPNKAICPQAFRDPPIPSTLDRDLLPTGIRLLARVTLAQNGRFLPYEAPHAVQRSPFSSHTQVAASLASNAPFFHSLYSDSDAKETCTLTPLQKEGGLL